MLSKEVCKECISEYRTTMTFGVLPKRAPSPFEDSRDEEPHPWTQHDDDLWETGQVACPIVDRLLHLDAVPFECIYLTEQLVLEQEADHDLQDVWE